MPAAPRTLLRSCVRRARSVAERWEFALSGAAAPAARPAIAASTSPRAGDGDYDSDIASQCGAGNATLGSAGGPPSLGNSNYSLTVATTTQSLYLLFAGFDRCSFGGTIPLPLDATPILPDLAGCWVLADAAVSLSGVTVGAPATVPLPIPSSPAFLNAKVFSQVLAFDLVTGNAAMSSGFATSIGW